ncbi:related to Glioma tumor suppressor candidate region gene 2 protein [Sporisorium reilianum f. sp. reilianum]|uniref:Ribosome biogenesis protein NOP53 n=1 Tax=Sporisorium reilianum f. sp. reilianum TaxID=72559 RepID=A0A2N8ULT9_9BASI|nr:related to Glioma tumor suppressor candidate region gene 2 protein [Sporisorium reilianum f. sp. reilianum]
MAPTRAKASALGQPAQPNQSSRKGKKAWRKNIDLSTTEAFLEEQAHPLRQTASDVLFVEDRSGQETLLAKQARTKRPLKSLEILQNSYGHAALEPARKHKAGKAVDKKTEQRLRKMVGRQKVATQGDASAIAHNSADVVSKSLGSVYDVWSSTDAKGKSKASATSDDWIPPTSAKPTITLPKTLRRADNDIATTLPAIDLPHPGSSYNPDLESHEALINEAYDIEKRLEDNEQMDRAERESWQAKLAGIVAREAELRAQQDDDLKRYRGMDVDVPGSASDTDADSDDVEEDDGQEEGGQQRAEAQDTRPARTRQTRPSPAIRSRPSQAGPHRRGGHPPAPGAQTPPGAPCARTPPSRPPPPRTQTRRARQTRPRRHQARQTHRAPPARRCADPRELAESLRTLKPEGNLFRDRYVRMQARGHVEPRVRQERTRRVRKTKEYETHDYKKFQ